MSIFFQGGHRNNKWRAFANVPVIKVRFLVPPKLNGSPETRILRLLMDLLHPKLPAAQANKMGKIRMPGPCWKDRRSGEPPDSGIRQSRLFSVDRTDMAPASIQFRESG